MRLFTGRFHMSQSAPDDRLERHVRTTQIIVCALLAGTAFAFFILSYLRAQNAAPPPDVPLVTYMGLGFAFVLAILSFVLPKLIIAGARKSIAHGTWRPPRSEYFAPPVAVPPDDAGKLLMSFQTGLVVGAAMLEGPTFFVLIAYFLEGQILSLIAAGVLMGLLVARFPTRSSVSNWLDKQLELIDLGRKPAEQN
jgi:hypothetical protein